MNAEILNRIAGKITKPDVLNAIHACRPDHPLGRGNDFKWRNAHALVSQQNFAGISPDDLDWLRKQAAAEVSVVCAPRTSPSVSS